MDNMVMVLFEKETIYTEEVNMLFDGKSAEEVIAYIDERQAKKESYKRTVNPDINIVEEKAQPTDADKSEDTVSEEIQPTERKDNEIVETPKEDVPVQTKEDKKDEDDTDKKD